MRTWFGTVLLICLLGSAWSQCSSNWVVHDNSCYHFSHDTENWLDAQVACQLFGAHLVEINNVVEDRFILNTMKASHVWIGFNDLEEESAWKWIRSGSMPQYINWRAGEPNNVNGDENCAMATKDFGWIDLACHTGGYNYVCEKEMEDTVVVG